MCQEEKNTKMFKVHFLNVGQALAILISDHYGHNMLYDAGNNGDASFIVDYLKEQGVETLDLLICSHPHEDHIGGIDNVLEAFEVSSVIMSNKVYHTKTYMDVIDSLIRNEVAVSDPDPGMLLPLGEASVHIIGPIKTEYKETNNYSVVLKIEVGCHSILIAGDAEHESEHEILATGIELQADIISVSHHGSSSSNTPLWLNSAINGKKPYCIISAGTGNKYNHPEEIILKRIEHMGANLRRTDIYGTLVYNIGFGDIVEEVYPFVGSLNKGESLDSEKDPLDIRITDIDKRSEFVKVTNKCNRLADLVGWSVLSECGGQKFVFGADSYLAPGETFMLVSGNMYGKGDFDFSKRFIWSNMKEDRAILYNELGEEVSSR